MNTSTVKKSAEIGKLRNENKRLRNEIAQLKIQNSRTAKSKKIRKEIQKYWKMEWKDFVIALGEISVIPGRFGRRVAKYNFRTRWLYAKSILKAPRLTKSGKLEDYLKQFKGKDPKNPKYSYFTKISGIMHIKCRALKSNTYFVEVLFHGKWIKQTDVMKKLTESEKEAFLSAQNFED